MTWDKERIRQELRRLHRAGKDISYNALAKKQQSLVSAAAYHFGSYRKAIETAGIPYDVISRRPRWTKQIIDLIDHLAKVPDLPPGFRRLCISSIDLIRRGVVAYSAVTE